MNIYLIELLSKWISVMTLSIASLIGIDSSTSNSQMVENQNKTKDLAPQTVIIPYEVEKIYNSEISKGTEKVITKGTNGVAYIINGKKEVVKEPIKEKIEIGTKTNEIYTGKMTGYGADCVGCSGTGNLSCKTKNGKKHSLLNDGATYNDLQYGEVRILAAALEKFPCGTIVNVTHSKLGTFKSIVLDTGSAMNKALSKGEIHMDLAYVTQKDSNIYLSTTNSAKYEILRWGW